jgi:polysaccharide biosynthesis/export protein
MVRCASLLTAGLVLCVSTLTAQTQTPAPTSTPAPAPAQPSPASTPASAAQPATAPASPASTVASARTPAATPATARAATTAPEYRIGSGDKLRIDVFKETELSHDLQVRPDGRITIPLVGDLAAAGQTPMQLQRRLAESLKEYVSNPVVTVMVTEVADRVVYVMGEVAQPGAVPLKGPMTVLQALAVAGGFKEFANTKGIKVLRRTAQADRVETIPFNYKDATRADGPVFYLLEGDTVVVP